MGSQSELQKGVIRYIERHDMFQNNDRVLVAVSGGLDSVCLLDILHGIFQEMEIALGVVHVHHGIRGAEADQDLSFVKRLAAEYGLPFFHARVDAPSFAHKHKRSLEESARILRYSVFKDISIKEKFQRIAVAHTRDDQAETVLLNFIRGAGPLGLSGMLPKRERIVRPLLQVPRKSLTEYARMRDLEYREDETNQDIYYTRNRIRQKLIPAIEFDFDMDLKTALVRTSEVFSEIETYLQAAGKEAFKSLVSLQKKNQILLEIQPFLDYFSIVQKYALIEAFGQIGVARKTLNYRILTELIEAIKSRKTGRRVDIGNDVYLLVDHDGVFLARATGIGLEDKEFDLSKDAEIRWGVYRIHWSILNSKSNVEFSKGGQIEFLDFDKTGSQLRIRGTRPGDRFVPLNFPGHKTVSNFFTDRKIPHRLRKVTPLLLAKDEIVWICGYCIDDRFKISERTQRFLKLEITTDEDDG